MTSREVEQALHAAGGDGFQGVRFLILQRPPNVPPEDVAQVTATGMDSQGGFEALGHDERQQACVAAAQALRELFPRATVEVIIIDAVRLPIFSVEQEPNGEPVVTAHS